MKFLNESRKDYLQFQLDEGHIDADPINQFDAWYHQACEHSKFEPNAMQLSTVSVDNHPSNRVVLLKSYNHDGFVFFTNYNSQKARDIAANPTVALTFFWPSLEQQIRIEGRAEKAPESVSVAYFNTRPRDAQLSAWASDQSAVVNNRVDLEKRMNEMREKFTHGVPKPEWWGGFTVVPCRFEFWQGRGNRFHDRLVYELKNDDWVTHRLCP